MIWFMFLKEENKTAKLYSLKADIVEIYVFKRLKDQWNYIPFWNTKIKKDLSLIDFFLEYLA